MLVNLRELCETHGTLRTLFLAMRFGSFSIVFECSSRF